MMKIIIETIMKMEASEENNVVNDFDLYITFTFTSTCRVGS